MTSVGSRSVVRSDEKRKVTTQALEAGVFIGTCVVNDLICEMLRWTGMPEKNIISISKAGTGDFRMVVAGRADIYISDLSVNDLLRRAEGFDATKTKPIAPLGVKTGFYLAGGLNVPVTIRTKIRQTYERLLSEGAYQLVERAN